MFSVRQLSNYIPDIGNYYSISHQLTSRKSNPMLSAIWAVKITYRTHNGFNTTSRICKIMCADNIPAKPTCNVIITISNILCEMNYRISYVLLIPHRLQYINYQVDLASGTCIIVVTLLLLIGFK